MDIKHELVAILGFDPEELNTPEMDLLRFGIIENVGGVDALKEFGHDLKCSDDQLNDFGTMLPEPLFDVADVFTLNYYNQEELN